MGEKQGERCVDLGICNVCFVLLFSGFSVFAVAMLLSCYFVVCCYGWEEGCFLF